MDSSIESIMKSMMSKVPVGLEFSVADHVARAEFFLISALEAEDMRIFNWLILASVNSSRAAIEITLTEWDTVYKRGDTKLFLIEAEEKVRRFKLISTLRVHDFHRQAIQLKPNSMSIFGPIKMKTGTQSNSLVGISVEPLTHVIVETKIRNASVSYDRPIQTSGLNVFDNETQDYVPLTQAIAEYLIDMKKLMLGHFPNIIWAEPIFDLTSLPHSKIQ
jgi:hypothetical protein